MKKYGVKQTDELDKTAGVSGKCPNCTSPLDKTANVKICPSCGSKPFEQERPHGDSKETGSKEEKEESRED